MAFAGRTHNAAFVPPLQLAQRDPRQLYNLARCKFLGQSSIPVLKHL